MIHAALMLLCLQGAGDKTVTGAVVDADGKPAAEATVATSWNLIGGKWMGAPGMKTDEEGRFSVKTRWYGRPMAVMAMDRDRAQGGLVLLDEKTIDAPATITLAPLATVKGTFDHSALVERAAWLNIYIMTGPNRTHVAQVTPGKDSFSFALPPGEYSLWFYGTDIQDQTKKVTIADKELDLGAIAFQPTIVARHYGKEPPAWNVTAARGLDKTVKLEGFRGKWVLLEFWGYW